MESQKERETHVYRAKLAEFFSRLHRGFCDERRDRFPGEPVIEWESGSLAPKGKFISYLRARRLISKGYLYHLVWVKDSNSKGLFLHSIPVVNEFSEVFCDDLLCVPPDTEIEFGIDLVPDTRQIYIPPYRMTPTDLKELKEQCKDLLDKCFIHPSVSPWGAPVLFMVRRIVFFGCVYTIGS
ncbi:hypothetical protein FXO38_25327 [Capsicum annuum]|nr:hypothetical protein FXO38_25327 [Capsicum annuum]